MRYYFITLLCIINLFILLKHKNLKKLSYYKKLINFLILIEISFIFYILFIDNTQLFLDFYYEIKARFFEIYYHNHSGISTHLKP